MSDAIIPDITVLYPNANKELAREWVAALRSGKYVQGQQQLRQLNRYCCLGVLCDIVAPELWTISSRYGTTSDANTFGREVNVSLPPCWVTDMVTGESASSAFPITEGGINLAGLNDSGATFEEIATAIEKAVGL